MKKILTIIINLAFALPVMANAASFIIIPPTGSYTVGDTVTLNFSVDPAGSTVYAAMLDARFTHDVFEIVSFSLNDSIIALKQDGYNVLDNTTGVLTKTGGYPGGTSVTAPFGTLVLRAKGSGVGTFTVGDNSKLLDSNNVDQQVGNQTVSFTITSARTSVAESPSPVKTTVTKEVAPVLVETTGTQESTSTSTQSTSTEAVATSTPISNQLATVAEFVTTNSTALAVVGLMTVILALGYFLRKRDSLKKVASITFTPIKMGKEIEKEETAEEIGTEEVKKDKVKK